MSASTTTQRFTNLWLPPVPSRSQLPTSAADGMLIWVEEEERVYLRENGSWTCSAKS